MKRARLLALFSALALAPIAHAQTADDAMTAVADALGGPLSAAQNQERHPAHGPTVYKFTHAVSGGTLATIGASEGLEAAGWVELRTTDASTAAHLRNHLRKALGQPDTRRGVEVQSWAVPGSDARFNATLDIVIAREDGHTVLRMERRRPVADPQAQLQSLTQSAGGASASSPPSGITAPRVKMRDD